jgi:hypothetical protein
MRKLILLCIAAPFAVNASFFGPKSFDACITDSIKGVTSDVAARAIIQSCRLQFPVVEIKACPSQIIEVVASIIETALNNKEVL